MVELSRFFYPLFIDIILKYHIDFILVKNFTLVEIIVIPLEFYSDKDIKMYFKESFFALC